jgi:hypothetical protein
MFTRIDKPDQIRDWMDSFLRDAPDCSFIPAIHSVKGFAWNGSAHPGGLVIEGARPMSAATNCESGEKTYSLTNSDSGYTRSIGGIRLSDIAYIEVL